MSRLTLFYNRINTPKWRIAIFVLMAHCFAIALGMREGDERLLTQKMTQPLKLKTIALAPQKMKNTAQVKEKPKSIVEPQEKREEKPKEAPKKQEKPKPKEAPKKQEKPKDPKPKPKEAPKKQEKPKPKETPKKDPKPKKQEKATSEKKNAISSKQKTALAKLKQNIEKMDKKEHKTSGKTEVSSVPTISSDLHVECVEEGSDIGSQILAVLKQELRLPEKGEVTFLLTLEKSGAVALVKIEESGKSQRNAEYVESRVPKLKFPQIKKRTTLTITLSGK